MGVIKRGILGGFSGRVANVVGSSWKGIAYMKSLPLSVANPQTTGQTTQRNAFTAVVFAATSTLAVFIKPLWDRFAQGMSGYNDFVSKNVEFFIDGVLTVPGSLKASIGVLYNSGITSATKNSTTGAVVITPVSTGNGSNGATTDEVYGMFYNETQDTWYAELASETRNSATYLFTWSDMVALDVIRFWLCYRKADGTIVSNSAYSLLTEVV